MTGVQTCALPISGLAALDLYVTGLTGCQDLAPHHRKQLFKPGTELSEIGGFLAGLGTTFAAFPDLTAMLGRRSSGGMNPRMSAIMGAFQILWIYYGLLIASPPVIIGKVIAVFITFLTVGPMLISCTRKRKNLLLPLDRNQVCEGVRR